MQEAELYHWAAALRGGNHILRVLLAAISPALSFAVVEKSTV
jgi:hypothetical protein